MIREGHKHNWMKIASRPHNIQRLSFLWPYLETGLPQDPSVKLDTLLVLPGDGKHDNYSYEDDWMDCLEKLSVFMLKKSAEEQEKDFEKYYQAYSGISREVFGVDLGTWTDGQLQDWFERYSKAYADYTLYSFAPWTVDSILAPRLLEELEKINSAKAEKWFGVISMPTRYSDIVQQEIDLFKIAISGDLKKLKEHTERYHWTPVYKLGDSPWTEEDFRKQLEEVEEPEEELRKKNEELERRRKDYSATLEEIGPDDGLRRLIETVHLYTFLRDERADRWREILYQIEGFYNELAKRAGIDSKDALNLLDKEIIDFLSQGMLPENLAKREVLNAVLYKDGKVTIFTDKKEIEELRIRELGSEEKPDITEIKGMGAYGGVVQGRVRILRTTKEIPDLEEGEILVTHHTTPDFVPAMKKAAAIVTDEGGITSHAAIVSRELKTPCITATREGSNVLKTGDMVEVDANEGTIRILSR